MGERESPARQTAPASDQLGDRDGLRRLAAFLGVLPSYAGVYGRRQSSQRDAIAAVVQVLAGDNSTDFPAVLRRLEQDQMSALLPPVAVAWLPGRGSVRLRAPPLLSTMECDLESETGEVRSWQAELQASTVGGVSLPLPDLASGYYRLHIRAGSRKATTLVIAAPRRAFRRPSGREWGAFLPLYALHSKRSWGVGDFSDLGRLLDFVTQKGGASLGTLPLLAAFLNGPMFDPSPYSPASRLMWNEAFLDPEAIPRFAQNPEARAVVASPGFQAELGAARAARRVDWLQVAALKRRAIGSLATNLAPEDRRALDAFVAGRPEAGGYARFRAKVERHGPWSGWSQSKDVDFDPAAERYHAFVQWQAERQIGEAAGQAGDRAGLYLDLPVGVNGAGYDPWRWPDCFLGGLTAGAPPDAFFHEGQDWGFPPLHPLTNRLLGYEYVIAYVRHNLRHAARLRIDHVMGFHRLYVIPAGFDARHGVYVRYPADEMYAILNLESHRARVELVGENLGIVPGYVQQSLRRRGYGGLYILPFEVRPWQKPAIAEPNPSDVASLGTHDTPTFAAWWTGADIDEREKLGHLSAEQGGSERDERRGLREAIASDFETHEVSPADTPEAAAKARDALDELLAAGPARLTLVNLEDLWGEMEAQNLPGTNEERPNWRRKSRYSLEEIETNPEIATRLEAIAAARRREAAENVP